MVVFVHMDDILGHARWRGLAMSLEERFKVKSMVKKFGIEKTRRVPVSSRVSTLSSSE